MAAAPVSKPLRLLGARRFAGKPVGLERRLGGADGKLHRKRPLRGRARRRNDPGELIRRRSAVEISEINARGQALAGSRGVGRLDHFERYRQ